MTTANSTPSPVTRGSRASRASWVAVTFALLADALRPDHDVGQLEVDVGERAEQASVEAGRAFVAVPDVLGADDLVDAVVRQRGQEAGDIPLVFGKRMALPEGPGGGVLVRIHWEGE